MQLNAQSKEVMQKLKQQGIKLTDAPFYLPTWRGQTVSTPEDNIEEVRAD